jgi:hypothetical protein
VIIGYIKREAIALAELRDGVLVPAGLVKFGIAAARIRKLSQDFRYRRPGGYFFIEATKQLIFAPRRDLGMSCGPTHITLSHPLKSRHPMLFLRTAAGGFVDAATIVRLREETHSWVAICDDEREVALAAYYSTPERLKDLQHLISPHRRDRPAEEAACGPAGCDCVS